MRDTPICRPEPLNIREEIANSVTHGVGVILSVVGFSVLVTLAVLYRDGATIVATCIYGFTLVLLYTMSTLYHAFQKPRLKAIFRRLDHIAIYLLIAGTYTPFVLRNVADGVATRLLVTVWAMAAIGVVFKVFFMDRAKVVSVLGYIAMGWVIVVARDAITTAASAHVMGFLVAGGLAYTAGVIFYAWKRLPYHHAIWHLFVIAGSVLHYLVIFYSVVPA